MKLTSGTLMVAVIIGTATGIAGVQFVIAQQSTEKRTVLLTTDLKGVEGQELRMWRTDIPPGVVGAKHYHPGTECIYVLEGALELEKVGEATVHLRAGEAHCVVPKTVLIPRNASKTDGYKSLVVMIAPKGEPISVPMK